MTLVNNTQASEKEMSSAQTITSMPPLPSLRLAAYKIAAQTVSGSTVQPSLRVVSRQATSISIDDAYFNCKDTDEIKKGLTNKNGSKIIHDNRMNDSNTIDASYSDVEVINEEMHPHSSNVNTQDPGSDKTAKRKRSGKKKMVPRIFRTPCIYIHLILILKIQVLIMLLERRERPSRKINQTIFKATR